MLHHTRRWNRNHLEELHSAWLNGVGMLVWENVFGAWVGWNERDKALLRAMRPVQREYAELLATGEWTPLAAASPDASVVASRWSDGETTLWALANRGDAYAGPVGELEVELPARGIAAFVGSEQIVVAGGGDASFPARAAVRRDAPVVRRDAPPEGFVAVEPRPLTAVFRRRETGAYGEAAVRGGVEAAAAAPARLSSRSSVPRRAAGSRSRREVATSRAETGLDLAEARAYAAAAGARLPTEDEWQLAAEEGLLDLSGPRVWNWTESEHFGRPHSVRDPERAGRTGSGGLGLVRRRRPAGRRRYSLKLLLLGAGMARSPRIGFRLAVDLP